MKMKNPSMNVAAAVAVAAKYEGKSWQMNEASEA